MTKYLEIFSYLNQLKCDSLSNVTLFILHTHKHTCTDADMRAHTHTRARINDANLTKQHKLSLSALYTCNSVSTECETIVQTIHANNPLVSITNKRIKLVLN